MSSRKDRLEKLMHLEQRVRQLHETRYATQVAAANAARTEAEELARRFEAADSFGSLFPALYSNRISQAMGREQVSLARARVEAGKVTTAKLRGNAIEEQWRVERDRVERAEQERDALEQAQRGAKPTEG